MEDEKNRRKNALEKGADDEEQKHRQTIDVFGILLWLNCNRGTIPVVVVNLRYVVQFGLCGLWIEYNISRGYNLQPKNTDYFFDSFWAVK